MIDCNQFPKVTQAMHEESERKMQADLAPVTICDKCGTRRYGYRLGCCELGQVDYKLLTHDGRLLTQDVDVSIINTAGI